MNWLAPQPDIHALPILPQVHDGQHQELLLLAPDSGSENHIMVLRLWPSGMQLEENTQIVWTGNVSWLYIEHDLPLVAFLSTAADFETPLRLLRKTLAESGHIQLLQHTRPVTDSQIEWQGQVLLAWEP